MAILHSVEYGKSVEILSYQSNNLYLEDIPLINIAKKYGTPCYVYSKKSLVDQINTIKSSFKSYPTSIHYAVKANSNLSILNIVRQLGVGFEVISKGEINRVLAVSGSPKSIVFSGVGKSIDELRFAIDVGVKSINVESVAEFVRIENIARSMKKVPNIAIRINPDVDPKTHKHISTGTSSCKFGMAPTQAVELFQHAHRSANINSVGISFHLGSQILDLAPMNEALTSILHIVDELKANNIDLQFVNVGGGLGVKYTNESPIKLCDYADLILSKFYNRTEEIILEPGRIAIANSGVLLTKVEYIKNIGDKNFAILDTGMNDFLRSSLYNVFHKILPLNKINSSIEPQRYDLVGNICESSDFFAKDEIMSLSQGDILSICDVGAYGFSMSSNYNSRPRACEVMVDNNNDYLIRKREQIEDLYRYERIIAS